MSEKNILAYFKSPEEAQKAADDLLNLGDMDMQIDRFHKYPGGGIDQVMNPLTGQIERETTLTLGLENTGPDTRVMINADTSASGMSAGDNPVTGHNILLTVVVDESLHHEALGILRKAGAIV